MCRTTISLHVSFVFLLMGQINGNILSKVALSTHNSYPPLFGCKLYISDILMHSKTRTPDESNRVYFLLNLQLLSLIEMHTHTKKKKSE